MSKMVNPSSISSPIFDALYLVQGNVNVLEDLVEQLEKRLIPVLASAEPVKFVSDSSSSPLPISQVESMIRDQSDKLGSLAPRLQALLTYLAV